MIPRVEQADYVAKPLVFRFLPYVPCGKCNGTGTVLQETEEEAL